MRGISETSTKESCNDDTTMYCYCCICSIGLGSTMAAQAQQEGLINVDLSNLRADIAKDINVT